MIGIGRVVVVVIDGLDRGTQAGHSRRVRCMGLTLGASYTGINGMLGWC
jgi:hypothetical protein